MACMRLRRDHRAVELVPILQRGALNQLKVLSAQLGEIGRQALTGNRRWYGSQLSMPPNRTRDDQPPFVSELRSDEPVDLDCNQVSRKRGQDLWSNGESPTLVRGAGKSAEKPAVE